MPGSDAATQQALHHRCSQCGQPFRFHLRRLVPTERGGVRAEMTCPETEPGDSAGMGSGASHTWRPGDPCASCGSTRTTWTPVDGAVCFGCWRSDADD